MTKNSLNREKIRIRSSEIVRIVTCFNPNNLKTDGAEYSFVKDLIILKVGRAYNKYYDSMCKDKSTQNKGVFTLEILDIDQEKNTKVLETIRYKRLLCGSSFVRNCKELYIREALYDTVMEVLLTGIAKDAHFPISKVAKYSTYLGLAATDSKTVSMPNICVVDDYKKKIKDAFDIVEKTEKMDNSFSYSVINFVDSKKETEEIVNCFDGAGIISYERASVWAKELGLNYVPASFQIRVLNGIKGNLYTFPVTEYIQYLEENGFGENLVIKDLWNTLINVKEKNIDVFLTKSQFKFFDQYKNFDEWEKAFTKVIKYDNYEYCRTFNISDVSVDIARLSDEVWSAYQPLQTLPLLDEEIIESAEPTVCKAKLIYTDINEFLKYRGISLECEIEESCDEQYKLEDNKQIPWYYKALLLDDSLQFDPYIRKKIEYDLQSMQRRFYMGKILLSGNYQTAIPDLLALIEHIFNQPVIGILNKGEIYSNYWNIKGIDKVSIWRNPHIACEWFNAKVIKNEKTDLWFKYQNTGIVTDIYGTLPLRLGTMDFDGDTVASVASDIIYNAVERADIHTIRVVEHNLNKGKKEDNFCITDFNKIMQTNRLGFQNNIGDVTNKVTVLWGAYGNAKENTEKKRIRDYIKIMSVVNQLIIDFVKTGIKVPIPTEIMDVISKVKKPAFLQNKNGRWVNDNKILSNSKKYSFALDAQKSNIAERIQKQQKYCFSENTVDRLYIHLMKEFENIKMDFNNKEQNCQFTKLLQEIPYVYNATYPLIRRKIIELQETHNIICGKKYFDEKEGYASNDASWRFERFYNYCEMQLLSLCNDREKLLNYLIYAYYTDADLYSSDKSILWNTFGREIYGKYLKHDYIEDNKGEKEDEILKQLKKKEQKAERQAYKIKEMCSNANVIKIENLPENKIIITDAELDYIKQVLSDDKAAQRLAVALLAVYKKINSDYDKGGKRKRKKVIKINKGKKNEITETQICKLANIYHNQFENRMKKLHEKKVIIINMDNLSIPKVSVEIQERVKYQDEYEIIDINDVRKLIDIKLA